MRLRYIILMLLLGSVLSFTALGFLFLNVPPSNVALPILFSVLLAFAIFGFATSVLIYIRSRGESAWRSSVNLSISVRQGIVIGVMVIGSLWLASVNMFRLWLIVPILMLATYIEYSLLPESLKGVK